MTNGVISIVDDDPSVNQERRHWLGLSTAVMAAAGALSLIPPRLTAAVCGDAIRPFHVHFPEQALIDLRLRVLATRWPARRSRADRSRGAALRELAQYWGKDYDWRAVEGKLNALPMFVTTIDGLDIQFIHVRSSHRNALPLIITHGWPGSILQFLKLIGPLSDPTRHGGAAADAFDLVIPSVPGYGFSQPPADTAWKAERIGSAWHLLMKRLGYRHYVAQGSDWGSIVTARLARQAPEGLLGIHVHMPPIVPADLAEAIGAGAPPPAGLSRAETTAYQQLSGLFGRTAAHGVSMTSSQVIEDALSDSPAGLAAWMFDHFSQRADRDGDGRRLPTREEMLDDITLVWLTESAVCSAHQDWQTDADHFNAIDIPIPAAITVFPGDVFRAPRSWAERSCHNLIYFNEADQGGHFVASQEPALFSAELRAAFRSLRPSA